MNDEDKQGFFDYLMTQEDMSAKEAITLTEYKADNLDIINQVLDTIQVARVIPLRFIKGFEQQTKEEQLETLWDLGVNTKAYNYCIDVRCHKWMNETICEKVIIGSERLDKEWINKIINGEYVASDDARYGLYAFTTNKSQWDATEEKVKLNGLKESKLNE